MMNESLTNRKYKIRVSWSTWNPYPTEFENDYTETSIVSKDYFSDQDIKTGKIEKVVYNLQKDFNLEIEFHKDDSFLQFVLEEECPDTTAREIFDKIQDLLVL